MFRERLESRGKAKVAALKFSAASLSVPFRPETEGVSALEFFTVKPI